MDDYDNVFLLGIATGMNLGVGICVIILLVRLTIKQLRLRKRLKETTREV